MPRNRREIADLVAFLGGAASEKDLLGSPVVIDLQRCRRHYRIGWKRLAAGDRAGAEAVFRQGYEVMPFNAMAWWISRAVLIRMKDPTWPRAVTMMR